MPLVVLRFVFSRAAHSMSADGQLAGSAALVSSAAPTSFSESDGSLSHSRVASLSAAPRSAVDEDGAPLLVPGTQVAATAVIASSPSPQPLLPLDDASPSTPAPSRPSSALTPPQSLPAARTLSSATAASGHSVAHSSDALNTSDSGLHLSGEKPVRSLTGSLQPTPSMPASRHLSRQSSNSDAPLPSRSNSVQAHPDAARVLRLTNEALSLRKQSLRHAAGSLTPPQSIDDVNTLRALLAFQNKEIAAYKQQITTLTTDNNRLAAEVRAFPHSASEVVRTISSLREERSRMDGRIRALESEKKVWAQQMRNLHGEMNSMEREWIKDRQRLEEAVRREEERNERLMAEWDGREERLNALVRERKREADEHDKLKADMRDVEKRLEHAQAEYTRLVNAWREERLMGSEVEGRLRGEVYARLFAVLREVADKEAESRGWEREMGRKRAVQAGVEELERRFLHLLAAVSERDELLNRLREDNRRLLAMMQDESVARVRSMQLLGGNSAGRIATTTPAPTSPPPHVDRGHLNFSSDSSVSALSSFRVHPQSVVAQAPVVRPVPFPAFDSRPAASAADGVQSASGSHGLHPTFQAHSFPQRPTAATAGGSDAATNSPGAATIVRISLPTFAPALSSSQSSPVATNSTDSSSTHTMTALSAPPHSALLSPAAAVAAVKSPASSFLSAFFASAAASLTSKAEQQQHSWSSGGGARSTQQTEEGSIGHVTGE